MRERVQDLLRRHGTTARNGFLPDTEPLHCLPHPYYAPWEALIGNLPHLISSRLIRSEIDGLPLLDTVFLESEAEWQRSYSILGFLTHAYIWGGEYPSERLPPQITCPLLKVSDYFGLPPVATYAALNLWNFATKKPGADSSNPDNLRSLHTCTGSRDEEWFYLVSVAIEAKGSLFIKEILNCIYATEYHDTNTVIASLRSITAGVNDVGKLLDRMHEHCDPQRFYHEIRPLLAGSKGMAAAGLPNGVFYDEGDGRGHWRQYSGGSNAQSSLIQLLDIFLRVDHHATGEHSSSSSVSEGCSSKSRQTNAFMLEMRKYMPRAHRDFLSEVEHMSNIRDYVRRSTTPVEVREAYNEAVAAVVAVRDVHIRIVSRYIIMPSRSPPARYIKKQKGAVNLASASSKCCQSGGSGGSGGGRDDIQLYGTGGTELIPFLKRTRDETRDTVVEVP
ncbi:hypothetical protein LTS17_009156 [Exophiala oligosperma]